MALSTSPTRVQHLLGPAGAGADEGLYQLPLRVSKVGGVGLPHGHWNVGHASGGSCPRAPGQLARSSARHYFSGGQPRRRTAPGANSRRVRRARPPCGGDSYWCAQQKHEGRAWSPLTWAHAALRLRMRYCCLIQFFVGLKFMRPAGSSPLAVALPECPARVGDVPEPARPSSTASKLHPFQGPLSTRAVATCLRATFPGT